MVARVLFNESHWFAEREKTNDRRGGKKGGERKRRGGGKKETSIWFPGDFSMGPANVWLVGALFALNEGPSDCVHYLHCGLCAAFLVCSLYSISPLQTVCSARNSARASADRPNPTRVPSASAPLEAPPRRPAGNPARRFSARALVCGLGHSHLLSEGPRGARKAAVRRRGAQKESLSLRFSFFRLGNLAATSRRQCKESARTG